MDRNYTDTEIEDAVRHHHEPGEVPRDRMWARIAAARAASRQTADSENGTVLRPDFRHRTRWLGWVAATAAVLVIGIAIGRMSRTETPIAQGPPVPDSTGIVIPPAQQNGLYLLAAQDLFTRADYLLTDFKVRSCSRKDLAEVPVWAGGMLVQTRLLMDTPLKKDPELRSLLQELELVLAQIAGLSRNNCARDMAWITRGMTERATLDRLRMTEINEPDRKAL